MAMKINNQKVAAAIIHSEKKGCSPITIPAHSPIKKVYVEMVRDLVESEEQAK